MTTLTPKQRSFLRWADRATGYAANKPYEGTTAASLERRGLVEYRDTPAMSLPRYYLTDAGKAALKEIGE